MDSNSNILARKYATAFVNVFADSLSLADIEKINNALALLATLQNLSFFLQLPYIDDALKKRSLAKLLTNQSALPASFEKLIDLLIAHKRSFLIYPIMRNIHELIMEQKGVSLFTISSSHELDNQQREDIKEFLARKSGRIIMGKYTLNKKLIAGLRLQSNTLLWEHSLRKYLNNLSLFR